MKKVLVIEDNQDIRENTCELLEHEGYMVLAVADGETGLQSAKSWLPDIIFCDIMMSDANGYEVLQQLKTSHQTATIPFVFLTANAEKKDVELGMDLGADGYICKPFGPRELLQTIERCLA